MTKHASPGPNPRYEVVNTRTGEVMATTSRVLHPSWLKALALVLGTLIIFAVIGTVVKALEPEPKPDPPVVRITEWDQKPLDNAERSTPV